MAGALFAGWSSDRFGRRYTTLISCIIAIVSVVVEVTAQDPRTLIGGKCVMGVAIGIVVSAIAPFLNEISPLKLRGLGTIGINFCIAFGQFLGACVVYGCSNTWPGIDEANAYKVALSMQFLFTCLFVLTVYFLPESPYYLAQKNKVEESKASLRKLFGNRGYDIEHHFKVIQFEIEMEGREKENQSQVSYLEVFKGRNFFRTFLCSVVLTGQLWAGCAFVLSYVSYFFELAGISSSLQKTVGVFTISVGGNLFSYFIIEKVNRRTLYCTGLALLGILNLLVACVSYSPSSSAGYAIVAFVCLWAFVYQCTVGAPAYAIIMELPAGRVRTKTSAISSNVNSLCSFGLGYLIPYLFNPDQVNLGAKIQFVWAGTSFVAFVVVFFLLPETKGIIPSRMDQLFEHGVNPWKFKKAQFTVDNELILSTVGKSDV